MDDISDIRKLYDADPQHEATRLDEHQLEFDITWRWLQRTLPGEGRLLELGASTGRYTLPLAQQGYQVTALDLSSEALKLACAEAERAGLGKRITWLTGDARDLSTLRGQAFDAALVMGPLYHLIFEPDRLLVLRQVYELLKPGAPIISAFICRLGIMGDLMANVPGWIEHHDEVEWMLRDGCDPPDYPKGQFRGYFCRPEELAPLHESAGFRTLAVAAAEPCIGADDASYNRLEGAQRQAWLDFLFRLSAEAGMLGASRHLLYIGYKP
ncbi:MAG: methyltransferase domain-containing protein [Chloroflexi bacterium]|nr:methyltransferase domain-containing protein [Chloroflexota bacterium]